MTLPAYANKQPTFPELYEGSLVGPLFQPFAEVLLDRVGLAPGDRLLDIACGTGIVARLAKTRLGARGHVVGVDLSPQMLAVARTAAPDVEWREGNASALPLHDGETFDVVTCQQGLQFFPDKQAAVREMRRALGAGGRLAVATWRPLEDIPFFLALHRNAERHLGPFADARHSLGDANAVQSLLDAAGLRDVRVDVVSLTVRFPDAATLARLDANAVVGMSARGKEMSEEQRAEVTAAIASDAVAAIAPFTEGGGATFEISSILALARH
jgi:ubiquinone/menaquinone biosynthesis C-methylase UbiE